MKYRAKIEEALKLTEKQFDLEKFLENQGEHRKREIYNNPFWNEKLISNDVKSQKIDSLHVRNDDFLRYPIIINLLKKIKTLPKDFSLIDLGCGMAGVLNEIKKEFRYSNLYGVDALPVGHLLELKSVGGNIVKSNEIIFKFYELDFMELLELDFQCDVALMLNLYHHPAVFKVGEDEKLEHLMKNLEKGISLNFDYFITLLNYYQYESFKNGFSYYSKIPVKIIYEEPLEVGDGSTSQWVVVKVKDNTE
jgi:hypothetical protein